MKSKEKNKNNFLRTYAPIRYTRYAIHDTRGFTLLLAALVSSIVLALGISIFEIAQKQVTLSSLGRDSQFAFYAADTGAECALYWDVRSDIRPNTFATSTDSSPMSPISCAGDGDIALTQQSVGADWAVSTFEFESSGYCVRVSVKKGEVAPHTVIHADGFSTPCATIETSPRTLQRSVEMRY